MITYQQFIKEGHTKEEAQGLIDTNPCTFCSLQNNQICIKAKGYGAEHPKFMIVSDYMRRSWATKSMPFSGNVVSELQKVFKASNINPAEVYFTSLVKCASAKSLKYGEDTKPKKDNITYCSAYLEKEIADKKPKVIIACGQIALEYFFPKLKMAEKRCQVLKDDKHNCLVVPIYNPEAMTTTAEFDRIITKAFQQAYNAVYDPEKLKFPDVKYVKVTTLDMLRQVHNRIKEVDRIAYDLETNGVVYRMAKILSVGVSWAKNTGVSWPIWVKDQEACDKALEGLKGSERLKMASKLDHDPFIKKFWKDDEFEEVMAITKDIFENTKCKKGGHNTFFDNLILHYNGIEVNNYTYDTMVMKHLLDEDSEKSLDYCSWIYTDKGGYKMEKEKYLKSDKSNFANIPLDVLLEYNAGDAACTYELYDVFKPEILKEGLAYELAQIRIPLQKALMEACIAGMPVNVDYVRKTREDINKQLKELEEQLLPTIKKYYGDDVTIVSNAEEAKECKNPWNINSAQSLRDLFFNKLKCKSSGTTASGSQSTDESALLKLQRKGVKEAELILKRKKLFKYRTTYLDDIENILDENNRVHPSFSVTGTACITGDTLLLTDSGYNRMDSLGEYKEGEFIPKEYNIINANKDVEKSSHIIKYSNVPTIRIDTKYGFHIEGTHNHPVKVGKPRQQNYRYKGNLVKFKKQGFDTQFKTLDSIKEGDYIELALNTNVFPSKYVQTNLKPYDFKRKPYIAGKIPEVYNEDFAEFLGMYMSDGSLNTSNGSFRISITNDDPYVQNRVKSLNNVLFGASVYEDRRNRKDVSGIALTGVFLRALEPILPRGAHNKCLPMVMLNSPKSVVCAYIKGRTLDSTYIKEKHELKISIMSSFEADFIQQFLLNMGIISFRNTCKGRNGYTYYRIAVSNSNYDRFKEEIGVIEPKKYDSSKSKEMESCLYSLDSKQMLVKVIGIEHKTNDVYDIHVPKTHSFVAGGIVNHNTGRLSSSNPNCFSKDTEVLTDSGWKYFWQLTKEDKVAQWKDGEITFDYPLGYVKYLFNGKLCYRNSKYIGMCATPDHRCLVFDKDYKPFFTTAHHYKTGCYQLITAPYNKGTLNLDNDTLTVLVYANKYGAIGYNGDIEITISKGRISSDLEKSLKNINKDYEIEDDEKNNIFRILNGCETYQTIMSLTNNLRLSAKLFQLTPESRTILLDKFLALNNYNSTRKFTFMSDTDETALTIKTLLFFNGYYSRLKIVERRQEYSYTHGLNIWANEYSLEIVDKIQYAPIKLFTSGLVRYEDYVYCVTMPYGTVVVKLGDKIMITGQCQQIPRDKTIKCMFQAPEGYEIGEVDFSQAELRVLAALSNDTTMIRIYSEDRDLHRELAMTAFHKKAEDITKEERTIAKTCFDENSMILTPNGYVKASDLGDSKVLDLNGKPQNQKHVFEKQPGYEIALSNGNVVHVTKNHKFKLFDKLEPRWVEANTLKVGDTLGTVKWSKDSGLDINNITKVYIESIKDCTINALVMETDTHYFIGEGFESHNCNFLISYSGGPDTLKDNLEDGGVMISKSDAEKIIKTWHNKFKDASSYLASCGRRYIQSGFLMTPLGRKRHLNKIFADEYINSKHQREGSNFMIQSTAASLAFISLINISREAKKFGGRVISTVHDSILIEYPVEQRKNIAQICKKYTWVTYPFLNGLYMKSDLEAAKEWGNKKPVDMDTGEFIEEE